MQKTQETQEQRGGGVAVGEVVGVDEREPGGAGPGLDKKISKMMIYHGAVRLKKSTLGFTKTMSCIPNLAKTWAAATGSNRRLI